MSDEIWWKLPCASCGQRFVPEENTIAAVHFVLLQDSRKPQYSLLSSVLLLEIDRPDGTKAQVMKQMVQSYKKRKQEDNKPSTPFKLRHPTSGTIADHINSIQTKDSKNLNEDTSMEKNTIQVAPLEKWHNEESPSKSDLEKLEQEIQASSWILSEKQIEDLAYWMIVPKPGKPDAFSMNIESALVTMISDLWKIVTTTKAWTISAEKDILESYLKILGTLDKTQVSQIESDFPPGLITYMLNVWRHIQLCDESSSSELALSRTRWAPIIDAFLAPLVSQNKHVTLNNGTKTTFPAGNKEDVVLPDLLLEKYGAALFILEDKPDPINEFSEHPDFIKLLVTLRLHAKLVVSRGLQLPVFGALCDKEMMHVFAMEAEVNENDNNTVAINKYNCDLLDSLIFSDKEDLLKIMLFLSQLWKYVNAFPKFPVFKKKLIPTPRKPFSTGSPKERKRDGSNPSKDDKHKSQSEAAPTDSAQTKKDGPKDTLQSVKFTLLTTCKRNNICYAQQSGTGTDVVIKTAESESKNVIPREVKMLQQLSGCCHVIPLLTWGYIDDKKFGIVTKRIYHRNPLFQGQVNLYLKHVLEALECCHAKGIIHRDVKPSNVLHRDDTTYLIDFDLATTIDANPTSSCGTQGYMAPEVVAELPYNEKIDIWSFGITAIEIICGEPLEKSVGSEERKHPLTVKAILMKKLKQEYPFYATFIDQLLQENSENRPSASEALKMLNSMIEAAGQTGERE